MLEDHSDIEREPISHYKKLLSEPDLNRREATLHIKRSILRIILPEHNISRMRQVTLEEVEEIVKEMLVEKAPGPDGFTSDLFQACWSIIGRDVLAVVEEY